MHSHVAGQPLQPGAGAPGSAYDRDPPRSPVSLAAVLLLWNLVVRESPEARLLGDTFLATEEVTQQKARPARLPPLVESRAWP